MVLCLLKVKLQEHNIKNPETRADETMEDLMLNMSKALALATGDLGEFGLIIPTRLFELERTSCLAPALIICCYPGSFFKK